MNNGAKNGCPDAVGFSKKTREILRVISWEFPRGYAGGGGVLVIRWLYHFPLIITEVVYARKVLFRDSFDGHAGFSLFSSLLLVSFVLLETTVSIQSPKWQYSVTLAEIKLRATRLRKSGPCQLSQ